MEDSTTKPTAPAWRARPLDRLGLLALIVLGLLAAFLVYLAQTTRHIETPEPTAEYLSANELAERYGLGIRLIGVTAGGGMVDFRLKILDVGKARTFLQDPANLPRLAVAESGEALMGTEGLDDDISWEEGGILFILFSNRGGLIQPGTPVTVEFGSVRLEPILAQ
jgi:hypothetical protein